MKKRMIIVILEIILFFLYVGFYYYNLKFIDINKKNYQYFKEKKLVGIDGKINLSEVKSTRDELYNELIILVEQETSDDGIYLDFLEKNFSNESIRKEIDDLSIRVNELEEKKSSLMNEYNVLLKKYNSSNKNNVTVVDVNKNNSYNFPLINQYPKYPTGCESVALTMLLQYYGINVTPDMVISKLKKGSLPSYKNGIYYGGNPEIHFVGDPYSYYSFGVYEKPIAEVANMYKKGINIKSNFPFSEVVSIVQSGTPVMVWTSMNLKVPYISTSWIYEPTGETISWKANEHAVVVVDVNDTSVVIADPIGGELKTFSRSLFEQRYDYFGKKALYY